MKPAREIRMWLIQNNAPPWTLDALGEMEAEIDAEHLQADMAEALRESLKWIVDSRPWPSAEAWAHAEVLLYPKDEDEPCEED